MIVTLNGERTELPEGARVDAAVQASGAPEPYQGIAVAVEGEVVPRGAWHHTALQDGQRVEVVRAVQGG